MLYSNKIFEFAQIKGLDDDKVTFLVGVVNFFTCFGGIYLLGKAGRRTIMVLCSGLMAIILTMLGISMLS